VDLRFQYRMNADIMLLSNRLIYDDRLRCGNEAVARASLALGDRAFLGRLHPAAGACVPQEACWLEKLVDERWAWVLSRCGIGADSFFFCV
jgi:DNA replication ATP-dependent helicase Dna2